MLIQASGVTITARWVAPLGVRGERGKSLCISENSENSVVEQRNDE
jgi:hypothetical protein